MSTNSEINEILKQVLERTFEKVQKAFDNNRECLVKRGEKSSSNEVTTLVFPKYGEHRQGIEDKTRISEQELRFAFTEAFEEIAKENNLFYSVETPTESKYLFNGENTPKITDDKEGVGQSGNFDFVIHDDKLKRICLIEFKSGYPESKSFKKDFLKLANPNEDVDEINPLRYFIHLVEKFERNKIDNRLKSANDIIDVRLNNKAVTVNYVLFSLSEDEDAIKSDLSDIIKEKSHIKYDK